MDYRQFLKNELLKRQKKNRAYSLRAFSRDLGVSSSRLSEILNGKVGISETKALGLAQRLLLDDEQTSLFVDLVESEHSRSAIERSAAELRVKARFLKAPVLNNDQLHLLSSWHHLAILELLNVKNLEHSVSAFARKLGVSESEVAESIETLTQMGCLQRDGDKWTTTEADSTTTSDIPTEAIRNYHGKILDKARVALDQQMAGKRDFSSMFFAMNSNQLDYAKQRMREFRRNLAKELEGIEGKDTVYCLSMNFFSLTGEAE